MPRPRGAGTSSAKDNKNRYCLSNEGDRKMITRQGQGRQSSEEEAENDLNRYLEDAGCFDLNMPVKEKQALRRVLEESKGNHVEDDVQEQPSSSFENEVIFESRLLPKSSRAPVTSLTRPEENKKRNETVSKYFEPNSPPVDPLSPDDLIEDSEEVTVNKTESGNLDCREGRPHVKSATNQRMENGGNTIKQSAVMQDKPIPVRMGRGRGTPVKHNYGTLPVASVGKKGSSLPSPTHMQVCEQSQRVSRQSPSSSQNQSLGSPSQLDSPLDKQNYSFSQKSPTSPQNSSDQSLSKLRNSLEDTEMTNDVMINTEDEDKNDDQIVEKNEADEVSKDPNEGRAPTMNSSCTEKQPDSPVSVEDAGEEQVREPICLTGKFFSHKSPLESMMKQLKVSVNLPLLEGLEEFRGNKGEWMQQARRRVAENRCRYWDKLLSETPQWGPPILDGGYNKQTLFKQYTPKYSKLFSNANEKQVASTSSRPNRQAKTQAKSKIQDFANDEWPEPDFVSLRKSTQRSKDMKTTDITENKESDSSNSSKVNDRTDEAEIDEHMEDTPDILGRWQHEKVSEKNRFADNESEHTPMYSKIGDSKDVYEFQDEDDNFKSNTNKFKKNCNKGVKGVNDVEVEAKSRTPNSLQPNPQKDKRTTKLRLQKRQIARPSEHVSSPNVRDPKLKGSSSEQYGGENSARNNMKSENSGWISKGKLRSQNIQEISPGSFFPRGNSSRDLQPMQPRKSFREEQRPNDLPVSPRGDNYRQPNEEDDGAVASVAEETVACPICGKGYPTSQIVNHASGCHEYSGTAEGEGTRELSQNSEESNRPVEVFQGKAESSVQRSHESTAPKKCNKCKDELSSSIIERCDVCSTLAGQKRASPLEEDEGPAKKATRLLE